MAALSSDGQLPPLVVRNKRGRKVDETLPKSHQREVQRQFRARRAGHLIDLERRVSLLERENIVLRQWAGVLPATRPLLGRGPTGCDTTKPLIADDNDEELQLIVDDSSPHERNWPETPTARTNFMMDQPPQAAAHHHHQHHLHQHHHRIPDTASAQGLSNNGQQNHSVGGQMMPQLAGGGGPSASYEKGPAGYDQQQPYPDMQRFKPHPLYEHLPSAAVVAPPPPASHFDQNSSGVTATDRLLVKRESIYATPNPSALVPHSQQQQSSQSQQQQQPAATSNHPSLSHGSGYYTVPHRPTFPTQLDRYTSIHTDMNGGYTTSSTWSDPYLQQQQHPSTPAPGQRRPHPTLMTPVMPSSAGPSSASVAGSSPGSSQSATHANNNNGADTLSGGGSAADPTFAHHHGRGRSVSYTINGSAVNLSTLNANNGSQINLGSTAGAGPTTSANAGNTSAGSYLPTTAQFGSYHSMDNQEAGNDTFRQ